MFHHFWIPTSSLAPIGLFGLLVGGIHQFCKNQDTKQRIIEGRKLGMGMRANGKIYYIDGTVEDIKPIKK